MSKFPVLTMNGYSTVPALQDLQKLAAQDLSITNFSIKNSYGCIDFLQKVDLANANLDSIIKISKNSVEVYKGKSPEKNTGLNVPAVITLYSCEKNILQHTARSILKKQSVMTI